MTRKLTLLATASALAAIAGSAQAQDPFTIQLKWVTQAQFAGYYVAEAQGFYDEVGLDVTIQPGGPDIAPPQVVAAGGADVVVEWMPAALAARERGVDLVNVAQVFDNSGLMMTCLQDSGIEGTEDFPGHTLGVWFAGNEYPFFAWMSILGYSFEGEDPDVTVIRQAFNVDPLLDGQADCITVMIYNEYWQVIDAGIPESELVTFSYSDEGVGILEDGLYVLEENLEDPDFMDRLARFLAASMRGWEYAINNPGEAAEIVVEADPAGVADYDVQLRQMENIATLIEDDGEIGFLDPAAFEQTVQILLSGDSDPVITEDPGEAAWTHDAYEAAREHM